jgi:anti-anti-sigma factor
LEATHYGALGTDDTGGTRQISPGHARSVWEFSLASCPTKGLISKQKPVISEAGNAQGGAMLNLAMDNLGDVRVLRCAGRITIEGADRLLNAAITQPHIGTTVLDLKEISTIDAAGLGMLAALRLWAKATGTEFKLMNLTPEVEKMLELTNLRSVFKICSVREMMELMCRAAERSSLDSVVVDRQPPAERPVRTSPSVM